jgi:hypothetical protein
LVLCESGWKSDLEWREITGDKPLLQETVESDVVAGCENMAMVVVLIADRRVLSCVPPSGKACFLPHNEIKSMQTWIVR